MIRRSCFGGANAAAAAAAVVAVALGASACFAQALPDGIDACLARIAELRVAGVPDEGLDGADADRAARPLRLGDACPELADAIDAGAWGDALLHVSAGDLNANAFDELTRVVAGYERNRQRASQPLSAESLDAVLAALELRDPDQEPSLWRRIQKWFDERFASQDSAAGKWLEDWLGNLSVPERVVRYFLIALGVLLVITTAAVIVNELRIAGVLAGGALRKYSPLAARAADETRARDFDDIARAPLARRPALLLLLVLDRLRLRTGLPLRDSLTHRELVAAANGLSVEQSDALRTVAGAAERTTFGGWRPAEHEVDGVVARGRALVGSLDDEPSEPR